MPKLYQQQQRVSQEQPQTAATCTEPSSVQDIVGNILPPQPEQITEQPVVKTTTQTVDVKEKPTKKAALMRAALTTKFDSSSDEPTSSGEITTARTYQDIDGWFDPDNYLEEIKSRINDVDKKGVLALSMPDGHVYVSKAIQMMIVEKQMDTAGFRESEKSADPKQYMLNCLIAITRYFLEERQGTIDAKMIAAGFWGNKFLITKASTSPTGQRMYTPYHSDTFGPLAEMEKRKQPNTKIIKSVDLNINTIPVTSV